MYISDMLIERVTIGSGYILSGPALKQLQAHRAIHEGGLTGALDKTERLMGLLREGDKEMAERAADDLIDYWKTRVISHADAELARATCPAGHRHYLDRYAAGDAFGRNCFGAGSRQTRLLSGAYVDGPGGS